MSDRLTQPNPPSQPAAPERGRHRKQRPSVSTRTSLRLTVGGAGLAIPLAGAQLAHAAPQDVWNKVAACESSGNWSINSGNGYYGGLQFTQSTWEAYGGAAYASRADLASKDQQIAVAEKVLRGQGPNAWPNCGPGAGLTREAAEPRVQQARADRAAGEAREAKEQQAAAERKKVAAAKAEQAKADKARRATADRAKKQTTYEVVSGDTLSAIADSEGVEGGWRGVYERNRSTVGSDPDLILPGQELRLTGAKEKAQDGSSRKDTDTSRAERGTDDETGGSGKNSQNSQNNQDTAKDTGATKQAAEKQAQQEAAKKAEQARKAEAAKKAEAEKKAKAEKAKAEQAKAEKAKQEKAKQEKAKREKAQAAKKSSGTVAPVGGVSPTTPYRASGGSWSSGQHTGVDFPVSTGTTVKAVAGGKVVSAGWGDAYGYEVIIRHADGKYSQYAHLSAISVRAGQSVDSGQRLGRSGATGNATGPHLHFEVRTGPGYGSDIDPLAYLRNHGVRV